MNQSLIVNEFNRFVVSIVVGSINLPGCTAIPRTEANRHVTVGWSYVDGEFVDTRATYDPRKRFERAPA